MHLRAVVSVAVMVIGGSACGDDPVGMEDIPGVWEAISVNGSPVPGFVTINVGLEEESRSARYELYTFVESDACQLVQNYSRGELTSDLCRWARLEEPGAITIVLSDSGLDVILSGIVIGSLMTVTIPNEGGDPNIHVYRKQ